MIQAPMILLAARGGMRSTAALPALGSYAGLRRWRWAEQQRAYSDKGDSDADSNMFSSVYRKLRGESKGSGRDSGSSGSNGSSSSSGADANEGALMLSGPELRYPKVFVVELTRKPLFPGIYTPVLVLKNEKLIKEVMEAKKNNGQAYVGAFLKKSEKTLAEEAARRAKAAEAADLSGDSLSAETIVRMEQDPASHLYEVGTFAQVHTILGGDTTDSAQLLLLGHRRLKRELTLGKDPLRVSVSHLKDEHYPNEDITKATSMEIVNTMKDLLNMNPLYGEQFRTLMSLTGSIDLNDLSRLVDAAASLTSADDSTLQGILETLDVPRRANMVLELLKREVELCKLQADIREQVEAKIMKEQRRMILMEQLKSIKRELGLEKDDKSALIQRFQQKWEPKREAASEELRRVVQDELDKLSGLEPVSPEFNVTRNYLEWLTALPWGTYTQEIFDVTHAKQVLDEDHYGLDDVKQRILEFIAVSRLRGSAQGKILCLVGPPGVGKTSIGRSIARTLNRKYYRFSVGGLYDVAEIKGHRRTYVGAMPGKMVQCLKSTQSSNPLVLIDEIDKLGRGHTGDPASALLELLDPEQNASFMDHYLDVPIDLSKVLFVCTANVLDTIPGPLLDRMEVIRLSGYASDEKKAIARTYLEPQARSDAGVPAGSVSVTDTAMKHLIDEYCREAGVRNLKKHLEKVYRKAALKLVQAGAQLRPVGEGEHAAGTSGTAPDAASTTGTTGIAEAGTPSPAESASSETSSTSGSGDSDQGSDNGSSSGDSSGRASRSSSGDSSTDTSTRPDAAPSEASSSSGSSDSGDSSTSEVVYEGEPIVVDDAVLKDFVGQPPFASDRFYDVTPPGVVMGLAWTAMGGATLYVEAGKVVEGEGKGSLATTGQLGDVMRESATIAHTFARRYLAATQPDNHFFDNTAIHVHVPAGATPKDGPSAGCTIITALLSLALDKPVRPDLAMTGEVTLTGRVLPIGGVKEKLLAARRAGVKHVIFPEANKRDYDELSDDLKEGFEPHFVSKYEEVLRLALEYDEEGKQPQQQP